MKGMDATNQSDLYALPDATCAIVILEGISMYLTNEQLVQMLRILGEKYREIHIWGNLWSCKN